MVDENQHFLTGIVTDWVKVPRVVQINRICAGSSSFSTAQSQPGFELPERIPVPYPYLVKDRQKK